MATQLFINGQFTDPQQGKTLDVIDPDTEQVFDQFAAATAEDVELAVNAARASFDSGVWQNQTAEQRGKVLRKVSVDARVNETLQKLLTELEQFGQQNDAAIAERPRRMLNITRDTGEFLSVLVQATNAQRVLEIGTSNGYSTLWLAQAVQRIGGHVTTVELSEFKLEMAARNFVRSGFSEVITQHRGEAGALLESLDDACFDLIFLDSKRSDYVQWWPNIQRALRKGGLLVVDNATSHAEEMADFMESVSADPDFTTRTVPVGNGEFLATRCG